MKSEIRKYQDTYDALSPEELSTDLEAGDTDVWENLTGWKTTRKNLAVAQAAFAYNDASHQLTA